MNNPIVYVQNNVMIKIYEILFVDELGERNQEGRKEGK